MPLLQFDHPSNWLPTRLHMTGFRTDADGETTVIFSEPRRCANSDETCFVNFAFIGSLFDVPIRILVYPDHAETTLEAFDTQRWAELVQVAESPPPSLSAVQQPEDLIESGSLAVIETRAVTLKDGTPGQQRLYHWRQIDLSTSLVGSYTLFKRNDSIIEFHTDFTEEEWNTLGPEVQDIVLNIEVVP